MGEGDLGGRGRGCGCVRGTETVDGESTSRRGDARGRFEPELGATSACAFPSLSSFKPVVSSAASFAETPTPGLDTLHVCCDNDRNPAAVAVAVPLFPGLVWNGL